MSMETCREIPGHECVVLRMTAQRIWFFGEPSLWSTLCRSCWDWWYSPFQFASPWKMTTLDISITLSEALVIFKLGFLSFYYWFVRIHAIIWIKAPHQFYLLQIASLLFVLLFNLFLSFNEKKLLIFNVAICHYFS